MANILIIDDEPSFCKAIALALRENGHAVETGHSRADALALLQNQSFDAAIIDLFVPTEHDGLEILQQCKSLQPDVQIMIMTAHGSIERAVEMVKAGADDFIAKGFTTEELGFRLQKLLEQRQLWRENRKLSEHLQQLRQEVEGRYRFEQIIGSSNEMVDLLQLLARVVDDADSTVLLHGESGTGKELVARAIHYNGRRKDKAFVVVNCAALPEQLLESELFGHDRGAFTGAIRDKAGKFETADGGTLFLDEVGEISHGVQAKLLRFTQDYTFERLGANRPLKANVRIIAATNKDLKQEVQQGRFRDDLYYRLNVIPIIVPPLRQRKEDIPLLIQHFLKKYGRTKNRNIRFSPEAVVRLTGYHWPGNVRELENLVERLLVTAQQEIILPADLPTEITGQFEKRAFEQALQQPSLKQATYEFERLFLLHHLEKHRWNISEVARMLGERRDTLSKKIKRYGLKKE